jgi:hypothetical protein
MIDKKISALTSLSSLETTDYLPIVDGSDPAVTKKVLISSLTLPPISGVTKTVKTSGGDFTTIQAAINYFKNYTIVGTCVIAVDAGIWSETLTTPGMSIPYGLTIQGDTRALVGHAFANGLTQPIAVTNGGAGVVTISRGGAGNTVLTVSCATTQPAFSTAGLVAGDKIMVWDGTTQSEVTLTAVGTNTLTQAAGWPAVTSEYGIIILPNRIISNTSPYSVSITSSNITLQGFTVKNSAAGYYGVYCSGVQGVIVKNTVVIMTGANAFGFTAAFKSVVSVITQTAAYADYGYSSTGQSYLTCNYVFAMRSAVRAYSNNYMTLMSAINAVSVGSTTPSGTGVFGNLGSIVVATGTSGSSGRMVGFTTDYNPAGPTYEGNMGTSMSVS